MQATSTNDVEESSGNPDLTVTADPSVQIPSPEVCVICLERISEKAAALPCQHDQFDFPCLGTWIQQRRVCPLCKCEVTAIQCGYDEDQDATTRAAGRPKIFELPPPPPPNDKAVLTERSRNIYGSGAYRREATRGNHTQDGQRYRPYNVTFRGDRRRTHQHQQRPSSSKEDNALAFRRHVYRHKLYSLHVGTNRISKYRNITPHSFQSSPQLVSRARAFLRRELSVFDFLNPSSPSSSTSTSTSASPSSNDRNFSSNAEFLLEYIVSILKSVDLKESNGHAEDLLADFLGRSNARLFTHELEAWLRSPYEKLVDWDRHVQYEDEAVRRGFQAG